MALGCCLHAAHFILVAWLGAMVTEGRIRTRLSRETSSTLINTTEKLCLKGLTVPGSVGFAALGLGHKLAFSQSTALWVWPCCTPAWDANSPGS